MNTFQKSLLAAGVLGLGSAVAATPPAAAQEVQAYVSGSASMVLMNGASQAMGAEIAGPPGAAFQGNGGSGGELVVTPTISDVTNGLTLNTLTMTNLNVNAGLATVAPAATSSVEAAVANIVSTTTALNVGVSYTRAWRSGALE